jgi:hypothetical protein
MKRCRDEPSDCSQTISGQMQPLFLQRTSLPRAFAPCCPLTTQNFLSLCALESCSDPGSAAEKVRKAKRMADDFALVISTSSFFSTGLVLRVEIAGVSRTITADMNDDGILSGAGKMVDTTRFRIDASRR